MSNTFTSSWNEGSKQLPQRRRDQERKDASLAWTEGDVLEEMYLDHYTRLRSPVRSRASTGKQRDSVPDNWSEAESTRLSALVNHRVTNSSPTDNPSGGTADGISRCRLLQCLRCFSSSKHKKHEETANGAGVPTSPSATIELDFYQELTDYGSPVGGSSKDIPVSRILPKSDVASLSQLFSMATRLDSFLMFVGTLAACGGGLSLPMLAVLVGDIVDAFNNVGASPLAAKLGYSTAPPATIIGSPSDSGPTQLSQGSMYNIINSVARNLAFIGSALLVFGFLQIYCWCRSAARQAESINAAYVQRLLNKDLAWFDTQDIQTLTSRAEDIGGRLQRGIGKNLGEAIFFLFLATGALVIGLVMGIEFACVVIVISPVVAFMITFTSKILSYANRTVIRATMTVSWIPQVAFSQIRTVQMFHAMETFSNKYALSSTTITKAKVRKAVVVGCRVGLLLTIMTFSLGSILMVYAAFRISQRYTALRECPQGGELSSKWAWELGSFGFQTSTTVLPVASGTKTGTNYHGPSQSSGIKSTNFSLLSRFVCYDTGRVLSATLSMFIASLAFVKALGCIQDFLATRASAYHIFSVIQKPTPHHVRDAPSDACVIKTASPINSKSGDGNGGGGGVSRKKGSPRKSIEYFEGEDSVADAIISSDHATTDREAHSSKSPLHNPQLQNPAQEEVNGGKIVFKHVSFAYPSSPRNPALRNYSLSINAGETVALVGPPGSGKSTILSLIERFFDPSTGSICLDGKNVKTWNLEAYRQHIGYVGHELAFFSATIRDNIAYGLGSNLFHREQSLFTQSILSTASTPAPTDVEKRQKGYPLSTEAIHKEEEMKRLMLKQLDEKIVYAADSANALEFINNLSGGINFKLGGKRAARMPDSQKWKIALARAIVKDPKVLLLDQDVMTALEEDTTRPIEQALEKLSTFHLPTLGIKSEDSAFSDPESSGDKFKKRTSLLVTRSLPTLLKVDRIVLHGQDGSIVEVGSHKELMKKPNGQYRRLVDSSRAQHYQLLANTPRYPKHSTHDTAPHRGEQEDNQHDSAEDEETETEDEATVQQLVEDNDSQTASEEDEENEEGTLGERMREHKRRKKLKRKAAVAAKRVGRQDAYYSGTESGGEGFSPSPRFRGGDEKKDGQTSTPAGAISILPFALIIDPQRKSYSKKEDVERRSNCTTLSFSFRSSSFYGCTASRGSKYVAGDDGGGRGKSQGYSSHNQPWPWLWIPRMPTPVLLARIWRMALVHWLPLFLGGLGSMLYGALFPVWGFLFSKMLFYLLAVEASTTYRSFFLKPPYVVVGSVAQDITGHKNVVPPYAAEYWCYVFLILGAVFFTSALTEQLGFGMTASRLVSRVRAATFAAILRKDALWFDRVTSIAVFRMSHQHTNEEEEIEEEDEEEGMLEEWEQMSSSSFNYLLLTSSQSGSLSKTSYPMAGALFLSKRLSSDTARFEFLVTNVVSFGLVAFSVVISSLVICFTESWRMTFLALAVAPPFTVGVLRLANIFDLAKTHHRKRPSSLKHRQLTRSKRVETTPRQMLAEALESIRTISSLNLERAVGQMYARKLEIHFTSQERDNIRTALFYGFSLSLSLFSIAFLFYIGGIWVIHEFSTAEEVLEVSCVFVFAVLAIATTWNRRVSGRRFPLAIEAARRTFGILDDKKFNGAPAFSPEAQIMTKLEGEIQFRNVNFSYNRLLPNGRVQERQVFKDLEFTIAGGETIILAGAEGSGRSTLLSILCRFYDLKPSNFPSNFFATSLRKNDEDTNQAITGDSRYSAFTAALTEPLSNADVDRESEHNEGKVLLDGKDLRTLSLQWLREEICLLGKDPALFSGTIAENIALGKPKSRGDATILEIKAAAKQANAYDFIMRLPDGFDTVLTISYDRRCKGKDSSGISPVDDQMNTPLFPVSPAESFFSSSSFYSCVISADSKSSHTLTHCQKQRIAIARAILRDPEILLLDEVLAPPKERGERHEDMKLVRQSLTELLSVRRRTTIIIPHSLSSLPQDFILKQLNHRGKEIDIEIAVLKNGKIAERGTYTKLMANRRGAFRALVDAETELKSDK